MEGYINLKRQAGLEKIGDFNDQLQGAWARQLAAEVGDSLIIPELPGKTPTRFKNLKHINIISSII